MLKTAPKERKEIYQFAFLTGFRFSEIASMTLSSFDFTRKTVTVRACDAKNKNKDQTIPLHPKLIEILKPLCEGKGRNDAVFEMMRREDAANLVREDCAAAKVDTTHVDFHALRHTFITRLAESNVHPKVLQALARHSNIETTLKYYTHFKRDDEHKAIEDLPS